MLTDVTLRIVAATLIISNLKKVQVTGIQFEDGSGYSFNYTSVENPEWSHIKFDRVYRNRLEMALRDIGMYIKSY